MPKDNPGGYYYDEATGVYMGSAASAIQGAAGDGHEQTKALKNEKRGGGTKGKSGYETRSMPGSRY